MKETKIELITPEIAKAYLRRNISNRPFREAYAENLAQQMIDGKWEFIGDAIAFDENGCLINGQHRLSAVVKSNIACEFLVVYGLGEGAFSKMDCGNRRNISDVLFIKGVKDCHNMGSIVRRYQHLCYNWAFSKEVSINRKSFIHNTELLSVYIAHKDLFDKLSLLSKRCYKRFRLIKQSDYGGISAYLILEKKHKEELVTDFMNQLSGITTPTNNVINLVKSRYVSESLSTKKTSKVALFKLLIKTWNYWLTQKSITVLSYNEAKERDLWFI